MHTKVYPITPKPSQPKTTSFEQDSIIAGKKASRLSNFNPIRNKHFQEPLVPTHTNQTIATGDNGGTVTSASSISTKTSQSDNYHLVRMDSNRSVDSGFSMQSQYRVSLVLNKKEIELIRYTWNKMLTDEQFVEPESSLPIPGLFTSNVFKEKHTASKASASTVASSLFCRQFYSNLLSMNADLEKLFPSIKHQAVAFAGVMSFAISQLETLSNLDAYLVNLGKRHSRILGIEPSNFELMGEALINTFHERFGIRFTHELEVLWIKLYLYLANSLLQFGIDPVFRLYEEDDPHHNRYDRSHSFTSSVETNTLNYSMNSERPSIASTNLTSLNGMTMSEQGPAVPKKTLSKSRYGSSGPAVPSKDGPSGKANVVKRKRDCVIV